MSKDPIKVAQECLFEGTESLFRTFPMAIKRIINEKLWAERTDRNGDHFKSFKDFALHPLWHGLEVGSIRKLKDFVQEDPDVVNLVEREATEEGKGPGAPEGNQNAAKGENNPDNVRIELQGNQYGNNSDYLLSRLKRDAPDIAEDYFSGKYPSVRQAAIAAGIVKVPTPYQTALKAVTKLSRSEWLELRQYMDFEYEIEELN